LTEQELLALPQTKSRAIALNSSYYYTGEKCKNQHFSPRYTSSGNCIQCIADKRSKPKILTKGRPRVSEENLRRAEVALSEGFSHYAPENSCKKGHYKRCATTHNCLNCAEANARKNKARKWQRIKKIYGISKSDFFLILQKQNRSCAICEIAISEKSCHIDHCHSQGHVRGLLCSKCNKGLGLFGDSKNNLERAIKYLGKGK